MARRSDLHQKPNTFPQTCLLGQTNPCSRAADHTLSVPTSNVHGTSKGCPWPVNSSMPLVGDTVPLDRSGLPASQRRGALISCCLLLKGKGIFMSSFGASVWHVLWVLGIPGFVVAAWLIVTAWKRHRWYYFFDAKHEPRLPEECRKLQEPLEAVRGISETVHHAFGGSCRLPHQFARNPEHSDQRPR